MIKIMKGNTSWRLDDSENVLYQISLNDNWGEERIKEKVLKKFIRY